MLRPRNCFFIFALTRFATGCYAPSEVTDQGSPPIPDDETPVAPAAIAIGDQHELWFVELEGDLSKQRESLLRQAKRASIELEPVISFGRLWNGLSVKIRRGQEHKLMRLSGVKAIYPVVSVELETFEPATTDAPELATALAQTGANIAQSALGFTGRGVRVGVIDTGIDYDHPELGGCFGPGCRIAYGHDFVGDAYDSANDASEPAADPYPDDCSGHGTHVAGIIGANGRIKGVAPGVTFGAYRVFGCNGKTRADIIVKAMEMAAADGMRVVNMSIGASFQWPAYPTAKAADALVKSGIVVVASGGNQGERGIWSVGAPGVGNAVISVASFENTSMSAPAFLVSPDEKKVPFGPATGAPTPPEEGQLPLRRSGNAQSTADACNALPAQSLKGAVALIRRGGCTFREKVLHAMGAGAVGVVLYNNKEGELNATVEGDPAITVPVVTVRSELGALLDARIQKGPISIRWSKEPARIPNPEANRISDFSAYGLNAELTLKPDIGAPGGAIDSTVPVEQGGYATFSGTSMAAPHVAGAAALLFEARPNIDASAVRDLLQNYAEPLRDPQTEGGPQLFPAHRQGAGMLRIDRAIRGTTFITPAKLSLGEEPEGPITRVLTVTNDSSEPITYLLSHAPAPASEGPCWTPALQMPGGTKVMFSTQELTVAPKGGKAQVEIRIVPDPSLPTGAIYGGYILFAKERGGPTESVPYAGYKGDYQSLVVLEPGTKHFPWLATRSGTTYKKKKQGTVFSLEEEQQTPFVVAHFGHFARRIEIDVLDATRDSSLGQLGELDYVPHATSQSSVRGFPFDGSVEKNGQTRDLPNGRYRLRLRALKPLGEEQNPAHWEEWISPVFGIKRH